MVHVVAVGKKLGEGMVGVIYEAKWRGSVVAVKCLREGFLYGTQESKDLIQACYHQHCICSIIHDHAPNQCAENVFAIFWFMPDVLQHA
jgi:hypothetical protein